jgi:hypothetical protein
MKGDSMSGYFGTLDSYYRVKEDGEYPAPCPANPDRTWFLAKDFDALTRNREMAPQGCHSYTKHTGLCVVGIILKDEDVEFVETPVHLEML